MKTLILLRHAKSSWDHPGLSDFERPLNARGLKNAPKMGRRLAQRQLPIEQIISSPAKRALTTANIVAEQLQYPLSDIQQDAQIYEASVGDLMAVVQKFDDQLSCIMLVGHNPGLTSLSYYLTAYQVNNMPTCSLFCAEFDSERWENIHPASGQMTFFDYPKKIA